VLGAGAAGLMAALFCAREGQRVGVRTMLFESTPDGGRKILISGGGRCNVLPGTARPERYFTDSSPNLLRRLLRSWPLEEQREFFERDLGIPLKHEPEFDKLFPVSDRARDVRDALVAAVRAAGAEIRFSTRVGGLRREEGEWIVEQEDGRELRFDRVILATGGRSVPATGSTGAGLDWAGQLGHEITPVYPALTPLLANPAVHSELAGVTLDAELRSSGITRFQKEGSFLFTHRGYSGPVVLDASHVATRPAAQREELEVSWSSRTAEEWHRDLREGSGIVGTVLAEHLPGRLARQLADEAQVPWDRSRAQLTRPERLRLVTLLTRYRLPWTGDEGYRKAEVTGGGVKLGEVDPGTLESRRTPGLHLCGEILDAFGPIGGHNFFWAWATGRAAGRAAANAS